MRSSYYAVIIDNDAIIMTIKVIHELIDRSMLHCSGIVIVLNVCYSVSYGSPIHSLVHH